MLNLYETEKVPGLSHIQLFRDDENPHKFYMVSERPTIARDDEGKPLFTFMLYARDLDRLAPNDREVQQAYLSLTTQAGVSPQEEQKILQHLRQKLNGEVGRGRRYLRMPINRVEPELSYPPVFTEGTVEFVTFGQEMVRFSAGSKKPSLIGANVATYSQTLSQDGAELFRQAVEKGLVPAVINYQLKFLARIPAVSIHIHGDRGDFFRELKTLCKVSEIHRRDGRVVSKKTWPEIASLRDFRNMFHSLTIDIDSGDFRDDGPGEDATRKVEELAFEILKDKVLPSFFETSFKPPTEAQSSNKWLREIRQDVTGTIDIRINRRDVVQKEANPNAQLSQMLTPEEVKAHTVYVDLGQPYFQELDVTISPNVNFTADPVFALKVFLDYDQQDDLRGVRVKKAKEFLFKTSDNVGRFRQVMAKGADGAPKDGYSYWSELVYKDTGETIRIPAGTGRLPSREQQLVISYRRLGFVKVTLVLGSMPDNVKSALVEVRHPGSTTATARQTFELTRDKPTGTYFTYTGRDGDPGPYRYKVSYLLTDGQRMDAPEAEGEGETLTIRNPFEQTVSTRFLAQGDYSVVAKIIVDTRYKDEAHDFAADFHTELSTNGATATWTTSVRDPARLGFEYDVIVVYQNGSSARQPPRQGRLGETIPVGVGAVDALQVEIDAGLIDWTKYARAVINLEYVDPTHNLRAEKSFLFNRETSGTIQTWKVLLRDRERKEYRYKVRLLGLNAADDREIDWKTTTETVLVIR